MAIAANMRISDNKTAACLFTKSYLKKYKYTNEYIGRAAEGNNISMRQKRKAGGWGLSRFYCI